MAPGSFVPSDRRHRARLDLRGRRRAAAVPAETSAGQTPWVSWRSAVRISAVVVAAAAAPTWARPTTGSRRPPSARAAASAVVSAAAGAGPLYKIPNGRSRRRRRTRAARAAAAARRSRASRGSAAAARTSVAGQTDCPRSDGGCRRFRVQSRKPKRRRGDPGGSGTRWGGTAASTSPPSSNKARSADARSRAQASRSDARDRRFSTNSLRVTFNKAARRSFSCCKPSRRRVSGLSLTIAAGIEVELRYARVVLRASETAAA